jgi:hypothetical protein
MGVSDCSLAQGEQFISYIMVRMKTNSWDVDGICFFLYQHVEMDSNMLAHWSNNILTHERLTCHSTLTNYPDSESTSLYS